MLQKSCKKEISGFPSAKMRCRAAVSHPRARRRPCCCPNPPSAAEMSVELTEQGAHHVMDE
jgi:hypothetical protein